MLWAGPDMRETGRMVTDSDRRHSIPDLVWPDMATERGRRDGLRGGVVAALCLAASYLFGVAVIAATGDALDGPFADDADRSLGLAIEGGLALLAVILGWRLWRTRGRGWAWAVMIWAGLEALASIATAPGRGLLLTLVTLLGATAGLRATRALAAAAAADRSRP